MSGCIIQVPSLEKGDRIVVEDSTQHLPAALLVTYPDNGEAKNVRYINLDELPEDLRKQCERHILDNTDA